MIGLFRVSRHNKCSTSFEQNYISLENKETLGDMFRFYDFISILMIRKPILASTVTLIHQ